MPTPTRLTLAAVLAVAGLTIAAAQLSGARAATQRTPLIVGLQDDRMAQTEVAPGPRVDLVAGLKARMVRVDLRWDLVATRRPANATDPADPAYDWSHYDAVIAAARAKRITPLLAVWGTPGWAADPAVEVGSFPAFSRRPLKPADAGAFATAAARRYAPRGVHHWEMWNEPNIPLFLRPQFARVGGRWTAVSPRTYAAIAKSMFAGITSVDRSAQVAGGVTAPAGEIDPQTCPVQPDCRVRPQDFAAALNRPGLRPPMHAWAHHPYPLRKPSDRTPPNRGYVDLYNLGVLETALDATYLRGKPLWLTEFGIATSRVPQYPYSTTAARQARDMADAFRRVRADPRVRVFIWYLLQDHEQWRSGLLDMQGGEKPAAAVFRREAPRGR